MKNDFNLKIQYQVYFIYILSIVVFIFSFLRLFYGVNFTDEAQYVGQVYMLFNGGGVFQTDLFFQQIASQLFTPFYYILIKLFPIDPPLFLFGRLLFFLMSIITSLMIFRLARMWLTLSSAILATTLWMVYVPFAIPSISYNTIGLNCWMMSLCLLVEITVNKNSSSLIKYVTGVVICVGVFAYPSFLLAYIVAIILSVFFSWKFLNQTSYETISYLIFSGVIFSSILLVLFIWGRSESFIESLELTNSFANKGLNVKIVRLYKQIISIILDNYLLLVFSFTTTMALIYIQKKCVKYWQFALFVFSLIIVLLLRFTDYYTFNLLLIPIVGSAFLTCIGGHSKKILGILIVIPSLIAGAVCSFSSSNGLINSTIGAYPALVGVIIIFLENLEKDRFNTVWVRLTGFLTVLVVAVGSLTNYYDYVYRDSPFWELDTRIESGPYAGLITSGRRNDLLVKIRSSLLELEAQGNESILCGAMIPFCYTMTELRPMSRVLFIHGWGNPIFKKHVTTHYISGELSPDVVVLMESKLLDGFPVDVVLDNGNYSIYNRIIIPSSDNDSILIMVK